MVEEWNTPPDEPVPGIAPVAPHVESGAHQSPTQEPAPQQPTRQQGQLKTAPCSRCGDHHHPWKMTQAGNQLLCDDCNARQKRDNRSRAGALIAGGVVLALIVAAFGIGMLRMSANKKSPENSLTLAGVIMSGKSNVDERQRYVDIDALRQQAGDSHTRVYGYDPISKPVNSFIDTGLWGTIFAEPSDVEIDGDLAVCTFPKHILMEEMPGKPIILQCQAFEHPDRGRQWKLTAIVNIDDLTAALPEGTNDPR